MARYTCAKDAAATGSCEMEVKNCPRGPPNSFSICCMAIFVSKGWTESCKSANSFKVDSGKTSGRTLIICPNLIKVGPKSCKSIRACRDKAGISSSLICPSLIHRVMSLVKKGTAFPTK